MRYGEPWKTKREKYRIMGDEEWCEWFAWYPISLEDGTSVWLETVRFNQPMKYNLPRYRTIAAAA